MRTIKRARSVNPTSAQILKLNLKCSILASNNSNLFSIKLLLSACLLSNYFSYERVNTSGDVLLDSSHLCAQSEEPGRTGSPASKQPSEFTAKCNTHKKKKKQHNNIQVESLLTLNSAQGKLHVSELHTKPPAR